MSKSKNIRNRKVRRQNNAAMRHGPSAKPTHKLIGGRTGNKWHKQTRLRIVSSTNISWKVLSLRPYPGEIRLFRNLQWLKWHYKNHTGDDCEYDSESTGGLFVKLEEKKSNRIIWLIYAKEPHVLAHELSHVLFHTFEIIGAKPQSGNGEPFCYMLSQLMIDAK